MDTQMLSEEPIGVVHRCCCGSEVHKRAVQACLLVSAPGGHVRQEQRTFATTTAALLALADWLVAQGCTHVAMESTGVYTFPMMLPKGSVGGSM